MAPPDLYKVLEHHPDRVPADSPERAQKTKRFQQINDAYYTLSDPTRRRDYDNSRMFTGGGGDDDDETSANSPPGGFPWSSFGFGQQEAEAKSNEQFESVFEEMMQDEGMTEGQEKQPSGKFWGIIGGASGAAMGFIVANAPGALAGAVAGNRLGAIRDAKGKSVYAVFQELPQGDKAKLLSELAAKVFAQAVSN
ncbi:MAG: hypothetical protein Q9162_000692 [Coniocarpon cinnabarinum]